MTRMADENRRSNRRTPGPAEKPKTVTCLHCRYEYDAREAHCPICGHPWPWTTPGTGRKGRRKGG
ncbi:MAG: hypothetical protein JXR94_04225 [Candidatus Hydrogenedentes bacterium]|nr:hypothetical protein [Candidatus Hydrogenedentota bacterium]